MSHPFDLSILNDSGDSPYLPALNREPVICHSSFPELIDNTAREQFFTCPQKFFRSTIQHLTRFQTSEHLHFGGAFAAGLELMRKSFYDLGMSEIDSRDAGIEAAITYYGDFTPPEGSFKTYENLIAALCFYAETRPLATDHIRPHLLSSGKHGIEFTFAIPIPETSHPVTGNPILYAGRFDMLADFQNCVFVEDDKTTSRLGPTWTKQWQLNSQFTGYCWAARQHGIPVAGAIIRGQSILAKGFESAEIVTYRPQWLIDRWLRQLQLDIERMIDMWKAYHNTQSPDAFDYALGTACSAYSGCEFLRLCTSQNPDTWIHSEYKNRHWNPLSKDPEKESQS